LGLAGPTRDTAVTAIIEAEIGRFRTRILDAALRQVARAHGEPYEHSIVEKTNAPNLAYHDREDRARFAGDYEFILQCLRYARVVASLEGAHREVSLRGSPG
jgi:hypothetical protein